MKIGILTLKYVNFVEKKYDYLQGKYKKEKVINIIKEEIGEDRYNDLSNIINDFIEVYIGLSKGYIKLNINKKRNCVIF